MRNQYTKKIWGTSLSMLALALTLVGAGSGCKKTEKGETAQWERSLKDVGALATTYPKFKAALEEQRANAAKAMEVARELGDKEKRIEAMAAANRLLSSSFVAALGAMDDGVKKVRKQLVDLAGDAVNPDEKRALAEAKKLVEASLSRVESILEQGASNAAAAATIVAQAKKELDFAQKTLRQVGSRIAKNKRAAQDDKAKADEAKKAADDAKAAETAPWTCSYCQHENPHDATKCSNCGAERGQ